MRKTLAVIALGGLGALILTAPASSDAGSHRFAIALRLLLVPMAITMVGLVREWFWTRWLAIGAGIAVLPWAAAFLVAPAPAPVQYGVPTRAIMAFGASSLLVLALIGRRMSDRFESRSQPYWNRPRVTLLRWTVICNIASILGLYVFIAAYEYRIEWHVLIFGFLLVGLVAGVLLLTLGKTAGILMVAISCICLLPAGSYFVWQEAADAGEVLLFIAVFFPGVVTGWSSLVAFSRPMWQYLRGG